MIERMPNPKNVVLKSSFLLIISDVRKLFGYQLPNEI